MGLFDIFKKKDKQKEAAPEKKATEAAKTPASKAEAKAEKPAEKKASAPKAETKPKAEKPAEPAGDAVTGKFEIKKSKDDRYVFNLYAANKVIVATSQIYSSSSSALQGIKSVINNAATAPVEDRTVEGFETKTNPKWEIYKDKGGAFRFRLNAANGQTICHSQGYTTKASCKNGIDSIIRSSRNAEIDKAYLDN